MFLFDAIKKFEAWENYSVRFTTLSGHKLMLRNFCLYLRNPHIESIGLEDVLKYLDDLKMYGWDTNTFGRKMTVLKKLFKFFKDQGYKVLNYELLPEVRYIHKLAKVIDEKSFEKLLKSIKTNLKDDVRNRLLILLLWDTGARNGELCGLNVEDMDLEKKKATIRTEKAKHERPFREIRWTNRTNEVLRLWLKILDKKTGPLFFSLSNNILLNKERLTNNGLSVIIRKLCTKAGVGPFNPHSFRHHMAHDILDQGGSIIHVAKILGHSSPRSSFSYLHLNDKETEDAYRKFKGD